MVLPRRRDASCATNWPTRVILSSTFNRFYNVKGLTTHRLKCVFLQRLARYASYRNSTITFSNAKESARYEWIIPGYDFIENNELEAQPRASLSSVVLPPSLIDNPHVANCIHVDTSFSRTNTYRAHGYDICSC